MSNGNSRFQVKPLQRSNSLDKYNLYRAALEWNLIDPIVIERREDLKSEYRWRDKLEPYHHQVTNLITFCRRLPVTLLADDVGLGKTISAGLVISELISRNRISKILIVCPKILMPQWKEELDTKFEIPSEIAIGRELLEAQLPGEGGAIITTYQSARLYLDQITQAGFDMLILDEAHKLRNLYGVDNPPQVAQKFRQVLADRLFKYVLMLTATPIQNRLWDLYSLVDILTVARGHENPFGNPGLFARRYIADDRTRARNLIPEMQDEFRSIVYGYMSRVRRADANLHFPERIVQLHSVPPSAQEIELINLIAKPIQNLNRLAQISILQALVSSPHALSAQLNSMARNGTVPQSLASEVRAIVERTPMTAKLQGLGVLVDKLRMEQPERWRMVVFTCRRETQTTIQAFLEERKIPCGIINGDSGARNQDTIAKLKKDPPEIHVIVSTEAGSEGVNLQAANVLVNYDLPWNPMIVEQRIGRIQRLASAHASVCIFNIVLKGTFEEYIVGRLMEKLQMASHAIGDIEALLEASGIGDADEQGPNSFEEKIRQLILASLEGRNIEEATRKAEKSILDAKTQLEQEGRNIESLLGGMNGESGPLSPSLPQSIKSMSARDFVLTALKSLGARLTPYKSEFYFSELEGGMELICFDKDRINSESNTTLYTPGAAAFERLVNRVTNKGLHRVEDADGKPSARAEEISQKWVKSFGGTLTNSEIKEVSRSFRGSALVRIRASVAHDSYERLVNVSCSPDEHRKTGNQRDLEPINSNLEDSTSIGINTDRLSAHATADPGISEFCRFYNERKAQELNAAGMDQRKRKKLEDDFTPRLELSLVGLEGAVHRELMLSISYTLETGSYKSNLTIIPSADQISKAPEMAQCSQTERVVPRDCLGKCEISGMLARHHLFVQSETSGRVALPAYAVTCSLSGKRVLKDEVEISDITGRPITRTLMKTSTLSGKRAEPAYFHQCEFTSSEVLESELVVSQISGKRYRIDEQVRSTISGKTGHRQEFITCSATNQPLTPAEAERCEVTGKPVLPGILEVCEVSWKKVLPSELERSAATGKKALKKFFVSSSLSPARLLEQEAIRSVTGKFCAPLESKPCAWSGRLSHPEDLRICQLLGVPIHSEYTALHKEPRLEILAALLDGTQRKSDKAELWEEIASQVSKFIKGRCKVEAAELFPDGRRIAVCLEIKTWMGMKVRIAGLLYSIADAALIGRVVIGQRGPKEWLADK